MADKPICSIPDCGKSRARREWCIAHYKRWLRHGDPLAGALPKGEALRFLRDVALNHAGDECLTWPFGRTAAGYGVIMLRGVYTYAHAHVCEAVHGRKPYGRYEAAHSCGNAACCAPRHLRWATPSENQLDKRQHGTHNHGMQNPNCKLSDDDVAAIRALKGHAKAAELACQFGVSVSRINDIMAGKARREKTGHFN